MKTKPTVSAPLERARHTPGPWQHIARNRDGHVDKIATEDGRIFIQVGSPEAEYPILDEPHDNIQTANASLIAAAPELLAAARRALIALDGLAPRVGEDRYEPIMALSDAIAKAEGEQKGAELNMVAFASHLVRDIAEAQKQAAPVEREPAWTARRDPMADTTPEPPFRWPNYCIKVPRPLPGTNPIMAEMRELFRPTKEAE